MHSFKKIIQCVLIVAIIFYSASVYIMEPYILGEDEYYEDASIREKYAGTTEFAVLGASRAERAFDTRILEEDLGVPCFNFSTQAMSMKGRYYILKKELERNPIDTLIFEISYDTIWYDRDVVGPEGDIYMCARTGNLVEGTAYFFWALHPLEYGTAYIYMINQGNEMRKRMEKGYYDRYNVEPSLHKGYKEYEDMPFADLTIDYEKEYNTVTLDGEVDAESVRYLRKIVKLCEKNNVKLYFAGVPVSREYICKCTNLDMIKDWVDEFAAEYGIEFYDYNLLKDRNDLLSDSCDFRNSTHIYNTGAEKFSHRFTELMKELKDGKDISDQFYGSYAEYEAAQDYTQ